jgi:predicted DNA-binding transcriptional regulator AlpA
MCPIPVRRRLGARASSLPGPVHVVETIAPASRSVFGSGVIHLIRTQENSMSNESPVTAAAPPPVLLRTRDAARSLAISERLLWSLTARGEIPCVRISKRCVRYRVDDLNAWTARCASTRREPIPLLRGRRVTP